MIAINKELLIQRIKNSRDFTALEKRCLIDLVDNDLTNAWEITQYGMIPIKCRYENVPQDEKLLFYDEGTDDFFVGEVKSLQNHYGMPTHFAYLNDRPKKYTCANCGHAVSLRQRYCDRCGIEFKTEEDKDNART